MSPYSMPLCTVLTKCPAPPGPIHAQHGVPSGSLAAMDCRISLTSGHACGAPPGMIDGPLSAPSSPPEMPVPTKYIPLSASSFTRRSVSMNDEFPPSMMTSPRSRWGSSCPISSSTAGFDHHHDFTRPCDRFGQFGDRAGRSKAAPGTVMFDEPLYHMLFAGCRAVVYRDPEAVAFHVAGQVFAHDCQSDDSDV